MRWAVDMNPSEIYNLISWVLLVLSIVFLILVIFIKTRLNINILKKLVDFSEKKKKLIFYTTLLIFILFLFSFIGMRYYLYILDQSTMVKIDEKIVLIELDDWWNFKDTQDYLGKYGYTFERFRSVTDIINKYDFTATMGVTPYIFIEELRQNFPLKDDQEMVDYIREMTERGYELGMHGYNHCRNEYYCPQYEEVWYNVDTGRIELQSIFGVGLVTYFPPGNQWTTVQYENVKKAGFKLIGNTHVPRAYFDDEVIITQKGYDPIYIYKWYARDFRHTSVEEWIDEYGKENLFILQLHQNTFDTQEKLDDLDKFLDYIKKDNAKVMTYKEFYNYMEDKREREGKSLSGKVIIG